MNCPHCHSELSDTARFCKFCGKPIYRCATCGRVLEKRAAFCKYDGTPIPQEVQAALPASTIAAETAQKEAKKKQERSGSSKNRTYIILASVLLVCVLAAGGLLIAKVLGAFDKQDTAASNGTAQEGASSRTESLQKAFDNANFADGSAEEEPAQAPIERDFTEPEKAKEPAESLEPEEEEPPEESQDCVFPDSDSRYLSEAEVSALSDEELRIAKNEIYARHGRMFASEDLDAYFRSKDWYTPRYSPEEFDAMASSVFNAYESANITLIVRVEEGRK